MLGLRRGAGLTLGLTHGAALLSLRLSLSLSLSLSRGVHTHRLLLRGGVLVRVHGPALLLVVVLLPLETLGISAVAQSPQLIIHLVIYPFIRFGCFVNRSANSACSPRDTRGVWIFHFYIFTSGGGEMYDMIYSNRRRIAVKDAG